MNHKLDAVAFFFFFMLGVGCVMLAKMNDFNNMKEELTIWSSIKLYLKKEWKSYGFSGFVGISYAGAHDEWMKVIISSQMAPDILIDNLGGLPMISSALFGVVVQYAGYKWWLGRLDKKFKKEFQDELKSLREENKQLKEKKDE